MMAFIKKDLPVILLFSVAMIMIAAYFLSPSEFPIIKQAEKELNTWGVLLSNFTVFIGAISLFLFNYNRVRKRTSNWIFNIWTVVSMMIFIIIGLIPGSTVIYNQLYNNTVLPISATMWLVMCLFMFSAAYRAFKVRSFKMGLFFGTVILVMLQNAPIGEALWSGFGPLGVWISNYPVTGGTRAFVIAAAIGAVILGFRVLFGYERTHFGRQET